MPNDCLWYDKLWGPSQRVVTLFIGQHLANSGEAQLKKSPSMFYLLQCFAYTTFCVPMAQPQERENQIAKVSKAEWTNTNELSER